MVNKIFVSGPEQRIDIAGIQSHPWFTKNLPNELKVWRTGRQLESCGPHGDSIGVMHAATARAPRGCAGCMPCCAACSLPPPSFPPRWT